MTQQPFDSNGRFKALLLLSTDPFVYVHFLGVEWKSNFTCLEGSLSAARSQQYCQGEGRTHGQRSGFQMRLKILPVWKVNVWDISNAIIWKVAVDEQLSKVFSGHLNSGWFGGHASATVSPPQTTRLRKLAGLHLKSTSTYFLQGENPMKMRRKTLGEISNISDRFVVALWHRAPMWGWSAILFSTILETLWMESPTKPQ